MQVLDASHAEPDEAQCEVPCSSRSPLQVLDLGHTEVDKEMLELLLAELAERWTPLSYW